MKKITILKEIKGLYITQIIRCNETGDIYMKFNNSYCIIECQSKGEGFGYSENKVGLDDTYHNECDPILVSMNIVSKDDYLKATEKERQEDLKRAEHYKEQERLRIENLERTTYETLKKKYGHKKVG